MTLSIIKKTAVFNLLILLILSLTLNPTNILAQTENHSLEVEDLLPQYREFQWSYLGSVDYGHDMEITSIIKDEAATYYEIEGYVHDLSDGESDADFSIALEYILQPNVIIQTKDEETMLDSDYDEIELIREPLEEGNSWTQEVESEDGTAVTLESTITRVEVTEDGTILTVRYEDPESDYFEERQIKEGTGVIYFQRLMYGDDTTYEMQYSVFEKGTGLDIEVPFSDISEDDWYIDYVNRLVTLDLIDGYPDQTFGPNNEISVAEFIKITTEALSFYQHPGDDEKWYAPYVSKAKVLGIISEGEFDDYNRPISRQEMTRIIVNALGEEPKSGDLDFADADEIDEEFLGYVHTAVELDLIEGYLEDNANIFGPHRSTTRAEASKLFILLIEEHLETMDFEVDRALSLEEEFEDRLFQTTENGWEVENFDNKGDLIAYISEITSYELAASYVDIYYDYQDGELIQPPMDGPTILIEDRDFRLQKLHPREYQLVQETTTEMIGHYTLTLTYRFENNVWVIHERDVEVH